MWFESRAASDTPSKNERAGGDNDVQSDNAVSTRSLAVYATLTLTLCVPYAHAEAPPPLAGATLRQGGEASEVFPSLVSLNAVSSGDTFTSGESTSQSQSAGLVPPNAGESECPEQLPIDESVSVSRGGASRGSLARSVFLGESETIQRVDTHQCAYWGTRRLVDMVQRAAAKVAEYRPGARLTVGELSHREGGQIVGHSSHQSGRDVDLGFYFVDAHGAPVQPDRLVNVRSNRTARWGRRTIRFDAARTWKLVEAIVMDEQTDAEILLVNRRIRAFLLAEGRRQRAPWAVMARAARMMVIPRRREHPHLNHFHVRIFCAEGEIECEDGRPLWDWTIAARETRRETMLASVPEPSEAPASSTARVSTFLQGLTAFVAPR